MKVLFVEDEKLLADALRHLFERNGIAADVANDGITGCAMAENGNYSVLVLDVMLPGMSGLEILKRLRAAGDSVPVLLLTAKDTLEDKVNGLNSGADDYLVKPFETDELLARVRALGRRAHDLSDIHPENVFGDVCLIKESSEMRCTGRHIALTGKEAALLELLLRNQGHPKSKEAILAEIWGSASGATENSVELYIHYLRKKLKGSTVRIKTIRGQGYMLVQEG